MQRLTIDQILKPGEKLAAKKIDLSDPKNAHIVELFDSTRRAQKEILRVRDLPFQNLLITI